MIRAADTGDWIGTFEGHRGAVWKFRLNADSTRGASASADFSVKLWDTIKGTELHTFEHKHVVKSADFSPDGQTLITAGHEKVVRLFNLANPSAAPQLLSEGHSKALSHAWFNKDGTLFYTAGEDQDVKVWDRRTLAEVAKMPTAAAVWVHVCFFESTARTP